MLSFAVNGASWNKTKFLASEMAAVTSNAVPNRLSQSIGINTQTYMVGSISLYLRERQGGSETDFNVHVAVYEADNNGNPTAVVASAVKKASEITWTGWHVFGFSMKDAPAPASKSISIVLWQDGGDEDNYVSWLYSAGKLPGAKAKYSSDGGTTWAEHPGVIRLIKVSKSYNPFSSLGNGGSLSSSVATESIVTFTDFNDDVRDGGGEHTGQHDGTTTDGNGDVVISEKNLIASIVVDDSGSMGWNDRGKNKLVAASEIINQLKANYPGNVIFDLIKFGSGGIGQPVNAGGSTYVTVKLDPHNPTSTVVNADGSTPTVNDDMVAFGFDNLQEGHTYIFQSAFQKDLQGAVSSVLFNGGGVLNQTLGIWVPDNIQSVGYEGVPIRISVQPVGTGSEITGNSSGGAQATVGEVPTGGTRQIRKPTIEGRVLATSGLLNSVNLDDTIIAVAQPELFQTGETIDIVDSNGVSCGHMIVTNDSSGIVVSTASDQSFGSAESSTGGFIQETSSFNTMQIDQASPIELLVKDTNATAKVKFFAQTSKGGRLEWAFMPTREWAQEYISYIDQTYDLVTYITDDSGRPLPAATRIQYYIDAKPNWESLPTKKVVSFDPTIRIAQGSDTIPMPSVEGISVGDQATLISADGHQFTGYTVAEVDDLKMTIRILPPISQDSFDLASIEFTAMPVASKTDERYDIVFGGVDVTAMYDYAGREGQGRLPGDPIQVSPDGKDEDAYNQDRIRWLNGSFEIPTVRKNGGTEAYAAIRILPVTDDRLNTETEEEKKVSQVFDQATLTDAELAELDALEAQYSQLAEDQPEHVNDDDSSSSSLSSQGQDHVTADYILSPKDCAVGELTKFSSLSSAMSLYQLPGRILRFDMNNEDDTGESGLLAHQHKVYPAVRIKNSAGTVLSRYLLPEYDVYFASPVQIFCNPESGKTVPFDMCCYIPDPVEGGIVYYTLHQPGVYAASGDSIKLDYLVFHRGTYLNGSKMRVKIYDATRQRIQVLSKPWDFVPELTKELGCPQSSGCKNPPPCYPSIPSPGQSFNRRQLKSTGGYKDAIDTPPHSDFTMDTMEEATYLDGYVQGGYELDLVNGMASITIPAIDVVARLMIVAEVICPDNETISCVRQDHVWIKNPVELQVTESNGGTSGWDVPPGEIRVVVQCFGKAVTDNTQVSVSGSVHAKYNAGDSAKVDPNSAYGQSLQAQQDALATLAHGGGDYAAEASFVHGEAQAQLDNLFLDSNTWPPTPVKPSVGKTINGVANGFMFGPHGPVTNHTVVENGEAVDKGDTETFTATVSYQYGTARGAFPSKVSIPVMWMGHPEGQAGAKIRCTCWRNGEDIGYGGMCYSDGWDAVTIIADIPASKNSEYPWFDNDDVIADLLGTNRTPTKPRIPDFGGENSMSFSNLPGRTRAFYSERPIDPVTGTPIGEEDLDYGNQVVGWAAVQVSASAAYGDPDPNCKRDCCFPPCQEIRVTGYFKNPTAYGAVTYDGCPAQNVENCTVSTDQGGKKAVFPTVSWAKPLKGGFVISGMSSNSEKVDFVRDGKTSTEIWAEVTFSGKAIPLVARAHGVKDSTGAPMPMPTANLNVYYLDQEFDETGKMVKETKFRDGTLSLSDYTPVVSVCRTTSANGHYHSCEVNDLTGNGLTTGTFADKTTTPIENHIHNVSNFVFSQESDASGKIHTHDPRSVAITHLNPVSDQVLKICIEMSLSYDASKSPVSRTFSGSICSEGIVDDVWTMDLKVPKNVLVEEDVGVENGGATAFVTLYHTVNGYAREVDDGIRVSFNVTAYAAKANSSDEESGVQTFDMSSGPKEKNYAIVKVEATAKIGTKVLAKKDQILYLSANQWTPAYEAMLDQPTNDEIYISEALAKIGEVKGASMLYDAVVLAADRLNEWQLDNTDWKSADKIIFILTDGCENLSQRTINQVASRIGMVSHSGRKVFVAMMLFGSPSQNDLSLIGKIVADTNGAMVRIPIGYDPALIPTKVSELLTLGRGSFNYGEYTGTVDIGGGGTGGSFTDITLDVDLPTGAGITVATRFSNDGDTWTAWSDSTPLTGPMSIPLSSGPTRYMQYVVKMTGNASFESPAMSQVSQTYLQPSTDVIFMQPISLDESFDDYVGETTITHAGTIPDGASVKYGSSNSNTSDPNDYAGPDKPWFNANERSILLTRFNETTTTTNNRVFYALNGKWPSGAQVDVYSIPVGASNGVLADPGTYSLNATNGTVTFSSALEMGSRVIIDVKPDRVLRIAMRVVNYSKDPTQIGQLTVMFNNTKRVQHQPDGTISKHPIGDDIDDSSSSSSSLSSNP